MNIIRTYRLYILKYRLAKIFKDAEQAVEQGIETGDTVYVELYTKAVLLTRIFNSHYPGGRIDDTIPAMEDLRKLTIPPEPLSIKPIINKVVIIGISAFLLVGFVPAAINVSYQGWMYAFHLLHLVR